MCSTYSDSILLTACRYDAYLEATHYEIRQKGNQDLLGSTKRFLKTDGRTDEEQYPIYLTPAGLRLQDVSDRLVFKQR